MEWGGYFILLDVIAKADEYLLDNYNIDFSKCLSASSMAIKIYRTNIHGY